MRDGQPVAVLGPIPKARRLGDLPALLESLPRLGVAEAEAFERDVEAGRGAWYCRDEDRS